MKTPLPTTRHAALLAGLALVAGARATVIVHDVSVPIPFDQAQTGVVFNIATGAFGQDPGDPALSGADFLLFLNNQDRRPGLNFAYSIDQPDNRCVGTNFIGPFSLDPDTTVDDAQPFTGNNGLATAFRQDRTGYLGVRFFNEATKAVNYGWMEITTVVGTNAATFAATVDRFAYEDSGAGITTPQAVPEPASLAALGLGALALLRRRRRA